MFWILQGNLNENIVHWRTDSKQRKEELDFHQFQLVLHQACMNKQ